MMADGARRSQRPGGASPTPASAVPDLLQQLRALGLNQGRTSKTYAGLAAAGRSSSAQGQAEGGARQAGTMAQEPGGPHAGGRGYSKEKVASAFFKKHSGTDLAGRAGQQQQPQRHGTPAAGSTTPPSRPAARVSTPDSAASPFIDEDTLLFQMSGLKPLRTSSRTGAGPAAAAFYHFQQQQQPVHRTKSAPSAAAGLSPPVSRAFSFAGEPSPRVQAAPLPTTRAAAASTHGDDEEFPANGMQRCGSLSEQELAAELVGCAAGGASTSTSSEATPQAAAAAAEGLPSDGQSAATPPAPPPLAGWSEELLNWMLSEKAGLLVEAQRAQRRQQELAAELERLRARGNGAEQEVQRLTAERRSLLDRVQRLSASEAEAAAGVERLSMENDALNDELERSQEVCREILAARRAARDALSEMSGQNARLLAAYVEKKQEAAHLKDALRRQQRQAEAHIRALEAQLHTAAQAASAGLSGQVCSPRGSTPAPAGAASPGGQQGCASPDARFSPAADQGLHSEDSDQSAYGADAHGGGGGDGGSYAMHGPGPGRPGSSPLPNKENANAAGNGSSRGGRQADKAQWDAERSELLTLLERLQDQLSAHAEQQQHAAAGAGGRHGATPRQQAAPACGYAPPPPSPFYQPGYPGEEEGYSQEEEGEDCQQEAWTPPPTASTRAEDSAADCQTGGARRGTRAASNLDTSFASVDSECGRGGRASAAASCDSTGFVVGGSPAVMAHHVTDSPPLPYSCARSAAPSPPTVRQQRSPAAASPSAEQTPSSAAPGAQSSPAAWHEQQQEEQQPQRARTPSSGHRTMESFFSCPAECGATPVPPSPAPPPQAAAEQQRLQQAEQRAADLEAELEQLRQANAAAEQRAQRDERRRAAESAKAAGNAAFQAQRFEEAAQHYSSGLDAGAAQEDAPLAAVLHCNRAAALHACGRYLDALADCFRAEALDASYSRVYHRRADAYWALGAYDAAAQDLAQLIKLGASTDVASRLADAQRRCKAQQPINHYAVLGVKPAAAPREIKSAYRTAALRYHPDKAATASGLGPGASDAIFKLLSEAYRVLADGEQRRHFDITSLRFKYRRFYNYAF